MSFRDLLGKELLFFDGGMGTMLQAAGLAPGEIPEYWNMEHPEAVCDIHYQYYMAGANIVETNTFGANSVKMPQDKYTSHDVMVKAVGLAKEAAEKCKKETGRDKLFVAASMGPTGKLMQPMGDLTFDAAYEGFKELAIAAEEAGAEAVHVSCAGAGEVRAEQPGDRFSEGARNMHKPSVAGYDGVHHGCQRNGTLYRCAPHHVVHARRGGSAAYLARGSLFVVPAAHEVHIVSGVRREAAEFYPSLHGPSFYGRARAYGQAELFTLSPAKLEPFVGCGRRTKI